jgi:hypothetical protein
MTLGFAIFILFLGNAVGLNVSNVGRADAGAALKFWSFLYSAVTLVYSYFLGAALSGRMTMFRNRAAGSVHGLTTWGLATTIFLGVEAIAGLEMPTQVTGGIDLTTWLIVCIVGVGAIAAAAGGLAGRRYEHRVMSEEPSDKVAA